MSSMTARIASSSSVLCLSACLLSFMAGCGKDAGPADVGKAEAGNAEAGPATNEPPAPPPLSQAQLEALYVASKGRVEATIDLPEAAFVEIKADLMRVASEAEDAHLRANASLLLGGMHEDRNDQRSAISFYRQAMELIPEEAAPHIVLALALSKDEKWEAAIVEQWIVVEMIPDDLIGWLLLGELLVKGGDLEQAAQVYGAYELRRKGLLDGLTLKHDGAYVKDEAERAACAEALAPAVDNGTALALLYALDSETSPVVRERIAAIMGEQRLVGYQKLLEDKLATEEVAEVKQAIEWALAEIQREPIETAPGPVPESIATQVEAEAAAQAAAAAEPEAAEPGAAEPGAAGADAEAKPAVDPG
jgi:tetratricopeptide (TPR) repeat protein